MDVSRRRLLAGALGVLGLGLGGAAVATVMTHGAPDSPDALPTGPSASPTPETVDLDLHLWDRVTRPFSDAEGATAELVGGALPPGLGIAGRFLTGRLTASQPYRFELGIRQGGRDRRQVFAGEVGGIKRDLSVSLSLDARTPLSLTAKELDRIARIGATATLVILCTIPDPTSTTFTRVSDARIHEVFRMARERSVRILLVKPHIVTRDQGDDFYRADYRPASVDDFFTQWGAQLQYFAQLCTDNDVEYLSLACEQPGQTDAAMYERWVPLVAKLRAAQPALKLTVAFTTLELFLLYTYWIPQATPHLARLLDVFGINSWVRLTDKVYTPATPNITGDELVAGWRGGGGRTDDHLGKLEAVCDGLGMPFLVTEVGTRPRVDGLAQQEGHTPATGAENYDVQALLYRSVLQAPLRSRWCTGASIWHMRAPFQFGDVNGSRLFPGERVLTDAIARTPALASATY